MRSSAPPPAAQGARRRRHTLRATTQLVVLAVLATTALVVSTGPTASAVPPTPAPFPRTIEATQPYVGQAVCDPVAKPGVRAFSRLLLNTYRDTGSLGIVRDCGVGGRSEHKEGRAFDWRVSATNPRQAAEAQQVLTWLLATDSNGHRYARARRLGIMYIIWNRRVWKSYDVAKGWHRYTGASPHTDHVHFSFGWNGARKRTSWFDGTVAPVDYGPAGRPRASSVVPVRRPGNLPVLAAYGALTLSRGSSGAAVRRVQTTLRIAADGEYGTRTVTAVTAFQRSQRLAATGRFGPREWRRLFPPPVSPFGALDPVRARVGSPVVVGWAIDADRVGPIRVDVRVDGRFRARIIANRSRPGVGAAYRTYGSRHGYAIGLSLTEGRHRVCTYGVNVPGTAGRSALLGCRIVVGRHRATGAVSAVRQVPGAVQVSGWALDPDTARANNVHLYVDGRYAGAVRAGRSRRVLAGFPTYGPRHGFLAQLRLRQGGHTVCAWSLNVPGTLGGNRLIGCRRVAVRHTPIGSLDAPRVSGRTVTVGGWTVDPDTATPIGAHVWVDGRFARARTAGLIRPAVARALPAYGPRHGFRVAINLRPGIHRICGYGLNRPSSPGRNGSLGCKVVRIR